MFSSKYMRMESPAWAILLVGSCSLAVFLIRSRPCEAREPASSRAAPTILDRVWDGYYSAAKKDTAEKYLGQLCTLILQRDVEYTKSVVMEKIVPILEDYHQTWAEQTPANAERLGDLIYEIHRATGGRYRRLIEGGDYGWLRFGVAVDAQFKAWATPNRIVIQPSNSVLEVGRSEELAVSVVNVRGDPVPVLADDLQYRIDPDGLGSLTIGESRAIYTALEEGEAEMTVAAKAKPNVSASVTIRNKWPEPVILSFEPQQGQVRTPVVIGGENFFWRERARNDVSFGGGRVIPDSVSSSGLWVRVPEDATTGPITVRTPGGLASSPMDFTVLRPEPAEKVVGTLTRPSMLLPLVSTGICIASGAACLYLNNEAWKAYTECLSACEGNCHDHFSFDRLPVKIVAGVALVTAGASAYLWYAYVQGMEENARALADGETSTIEVRAGVGSVALIHRF